MTMSAEELGALLELKDGEVLSTWVERPRPEGAVARGLSLGATRGLAADLLDGIDENPVFHPDPSLREVLPGTTRWDGDPLVLAFELAALAATGAVGTLAGRTVLDASAGESTVLFVHEGERLLVHADGGIVRVLRAARSFPFAGGVAPEVSLPSVSALLGEYAVEGWLATRLDELERSTTWYRRVAAAGLLARLGLDAASDRTTWGRALREGDETPEDRCVAFARRCSSVVLDALEAVVVDRCGELIERLALLPTLLVEGDATSEARAIVEDRDEIESLLMVLRATGRVDAASRVVELDAFAATWASTLDAIAGSRLDGAHGDAVAVATPSAWWAPRLA